MALQRAASALPKDCPLLMRDERGRLLPGHPPGPGRPPGVEELRPRRRGPRFRIVSGNGLTVATLDRLDRRSGPGRMISRRREELLAALGRPATAIEAAACGQVAYLECRLAVMEAAEILSDSRALDAILRAQAELRRWYAFIELRPADQHPRSLEDWLRRAQTAQDASEGEGQGDAPPHRRSPPLEPLRRSGHDRRSLPPGTRGR